MDGTWLEIHTPHPLTGMLLQDGQKQILVIQFIIIVEIPVLVIIGTMLVRGVKTLALV